MGWARWLCVAFACGVAQGDARLASAAARGAVVLVDLENVRGKAGFTLSHSALLSRLSGWVASRGMHGSLSLVVDHGTVRALRGWERGG